jgi:hypothetical protein
MRIKDGMLPRKSIMVWILTAPREYLPGVRENSLMPSDTVVESRTKDRCQCPNAESDCRHKTVRQNLSGIRHSRQIFAGSCSHWHATALID